MTHPPTFMRRPPHRTGRPPSSRPARTAPRQSAAGVWWNDGPPASPRAVRRAWHAAPARPDNDHDECHTQQQSEDRARAHGPSSLGGRLQPPPGFRPKRHPRRARAARSRPHGGSEDRGQSGRSGGAVGGAARRPAAAARRSHASASCGRAPRAAGRDGRGLSGSCDGSLDGQGCAPGWNRLLSGITELGRMMPAMRDAPSAGSVPALREAGVRFGCALVGRAATRCMVARPAPGAPTPTSGVRARIRIEPNR